MSFRDIRMASLSLKMKLSEYSWFQEINICESSSGFFIEVISTKPVDKIPKKWQGFPVRVT